MKDQSTYIRVLQRGGMVVLGENCAHLFRTEDARRAKVGMLDKVLVERLLADGQLQYMSQDHMRLIWAGRAQKDENVPLKRVKLPVADMRQTPARTALEYILRAQRDVDAQAYLLRAASRFQREVEAYHRGQSVTMNWAFAPRGSKRSAGQAGGMNETSLRAGRMLRQLKNTLGDEAMTLLHAILIQGSSVKKIILDYGISRVQLAPYGLDALLRLARAYDRSVAPEPYQEASIASASA